MPVVFDEIEAEIAPVNRPTEPPAGDTHQAQDPGKLADAVRRELTRFEMRQARLRAD